jgi:hypothetical protein
MAMKTYFVFDKETGYILSGFDCCSDDHKDGYNIFNRPYKCPELHPKNEKCRLDFLFNLSKREGLNNLKYSNMIVSVVDHPHDIKCHFVENPNYLNSRYAIRGWWKLDESVHHLQELAK